MPVAKLVLEGLGLGLPLCLVCAIGIRDGAVGMTRLYGRRARDSAMRPGTVSEEAIGGRGALLWGQRTMPLDRSMNVCTKR